MKMLTDLISTDYGLMSLVVIAIVIMMWIYFTVLFMGKINSSSKTASSDKNLKTKT